MVRATTQVQMRSLCDGRAAVAHFCSLSTVMPSQVQHAVSFAAIYLVKAVEAASAAESIGCVEELHAIGGQPVGCGVGESAGKQCNNSTRLRVVSTHEVVYTLISPGATIQVRWSA
jgi:hypothetical protein